MPSFLHRSNAPVRRARASVTSTRLRATKVKKHMEGKHRLRHGERVGQALPRDNLAAVRNYNPGSSQTSCGTLVDARMLKLFLRILVLTAAIEGASLAVADELILVSLLMSASTLAATGVGVLLVTDRI